MVLNGPGFNDPLMLLNGPSMLHDLSVFHGALLALSVTFIVTADGARPHPEDALTDWQDGYLIFKKWDPDPPFAW